MRKLKILIIILCILGILTSSALAVNVPSPTNDFYVNDYAGVLTESTKQLIMQNSVTLEQKTGAQIVVVTVNSLGEDVVLEDYSLDILRSWGIGDEKADNGVLLLLSVNDRMSRIEVGYGLEGCLPDGKTGRIQDEYMVPYFKITNYDEGIKNGYLAILQEVAIEYSLDLSTLEQPYPQVTTNNQTDSLSPLAKTIIGIFIVLLLLFDWIFLHGRITRTIFLIMLASRRGGGGGSGGGFRGGGGSGGGGGSSRSW